MKIGLQTWGSNGDIRPMLALASGLKRAGYQVELVVTSLDNRCYANECKSLGIGYRQIPEALDLDLEAFARSTLRMNGLRWLKALLVEALFPHEQLIFDAAAELVAANDLVVGHHVLYPLKLAAQRAGKPHVSVTLCHGAIVSTQRPPFRCPDLGAGVNRWQWWLFNAVFDAYLKNDLGRLWRQYGETIRRPVFDELLTSDRLDLVAIDPVFYPEAGSGEGVHRICGFFNFEDDVTAWQMPAAIAEFLDEGEAPVYCSFGSLQQVAPEWAMDLFIDAMRIVGGRAIIQTSSSRFPAGTQQGSCMFVGRHPHQPVFERCAAIVHHGGAGTTHSATRAGCPSATLPFMDEQLFWGLQIQRLGIGPKPLHIKNATAVKLARSLDQVLSSPEFRANAQKCRETMVRNHGVSEAVAAIAAV